MNTISRWLQAEASIWSQFTLIATTYWHIIAIYLVIIFSYKSCSYRKLHAITLFTLVYGNLCSIMVHIQRRFFKEIYDSSSKYVGMVIAHPPSSHWESDARSTSHSLILTLLHAISAEHLLHTLPPLVSDRHQQSVLGFNALPKCRG